MGDFLFTFVFGYGIIQKNIIMEGNELVPTTPNGSLVVIHEGIEKFVENVKPEDLSSEKTKKHYAKFVDPELLKKAYEQSLLDDRPAFQVKDNPGFNSAFKEGFAEYQKNFFQNHFWSLKDLKINANTSIPDLLKVIEDLRQSKIVYASYMMTMINAWIGVRKTFDFALFLSENQMLGSQQVNSLYSFGTAIAALPDMVAKEKIATVFGDICEINQALSINEMPEIVDDNEMKTLLLACPVLFAHSKSNEALEKEAAEWMRLSQQTSLYLSLFNDYIYGRVSPNNTNRLRLRSAQNFPDRETFPTDIDIKAPKVLSGYKKQSLILTPYVDYRLKELASPNWTRFMPIDPYWMIVVYDTPYAVMGRRWSGTGILPSVPEMMASTFQALSQAQDFFVTMLTSKALREKNRVIRYTDLQSEKIFQVKPEEVAVFIKNSVEAFKNGTLKSFFQ